MENLKKIQELNIQIFTAEEMLDSNWLAEFFEYDCLQKIKAVIEKFDKVDNLFGCRRKYVAENEFEEAALADLRHEMEILFYQIKKDCQGGEILERGALCDSMRIIISIFVLVPTIVSDRFKDDVLQYAKSNSLIEK